MNEKMSAIDLCERCLEKCSTVQCSQCALSTANPNGCMILCDDCSTLLHVGRFASHDFTVIIKEKPPPVFCSEQSTDELKKRVASASKAFKDRLDFIEHYLENLQLMRSDISAVRQNVLSNCWNNVEALFCPGKVRLNEAWEDIKDRIQQQHMEILKSEIIASETISKKIYDDEAHPFYKFVEQLVRYPTDNEELFRNYCEIIFNKSYLMDMTVLPKMFELPLTYCIPELVLPDQFTRILEEYKEALNQIKFEIRPVYMTEKFDDPVILKLLNNFSQFKDDNGNSVYNVLSISPFRRNGVFTAHLKFDHSDEILAFMEWHIRYRQSLIQSLIVEEKDLDSSECKSQHEEEEKVHPEEEVPTDISDSEKKLDLDVTEKAMGKNETKIQRGNKVFALRKVKEPFSDRKPSFKEFWSRGIVSRVSLTSCLVYFVDHGTEGDVVFSKLRSAPNFGIYSHVPCLAPECTLFEASAYNEEIQIENIEEINMLWNEAISQKEHLKLTIIGNSPIMVEKMPVMRASFNITSDSIREVFSGGPELSCNTADCDSEVIDLVKDMLNKVEHDESRVFGDLSTELQKRIVLKPKSNGSRLMMWSDIRLTENPGMNAIRIEEGNRSTPKQEEIVVSPLPNLSAEIKEPFVCIPVEPKKLLADPLKPLKCVFSDDEAVNKDDLVSKMKTKVLECIESDCKDLLMPNLVNCFSDKDIQSAYRKTVTSRRFQEPATKDSHRKDIRHSQEPRAQSEQQEETLQGKLYSLQNARIWKHRQDLSEVFLFFRSDWKSRLDCSDYESVVSQECFSRPPLNRPMSSLTAHIILSDKKKRKITRCLIIDIFQQEYELLDLDRMEIFRINCRQPDFKFLADLTRFPYNVMILSKLVDQEGDTIIPHSQELSKLFPRTVYETDRLIFHGEITITNCQEIRPAAYYTATLESSLAVNCSSEPSDLSGSIKQNILNSIDANDKPDLSRTEKVHDGKLSEDSSFNNCSNSDKTIDNSEKEISQENAPNHTAKEEKRKIMGDSKSLTTTPTLTPNKIDQRALKQFLSACVSPVKPHDKNVNRSLPFINLNNKINSPNKDVTPEYEESKLEPNNLENSTPESHSDEPQSQIQNPNTDLTSNQVPDYQKPEESKPESAVQSQSQMLKLDIGLTSNQVGESQKVVESKSAHPKESPLDWNILNDQSPTTYIDSHPLNWLPKDTVSQCVLNPPIHEEETTVPLTMALNQDQDNFAKWNPYVAQSSQMSPNDLLNFFNTYINSTPDQSTMVHQFNMFSRMLQHNPQLLSDYQQQDISHPFTPQSSHYEEAMFAPRQLTDMVYNESVNPLDQRNYSPRQPASDMVYNESVNPLDQRNYSPRQPASDMVYNESVNSSDQRNYSVTCNNSTHLPPNTTGYNWDDWADSVHQPPRQPKQFDLNKRSGPRPLLKMDDSKFDHWQQQQGAGAAGDVPPRGMNHRDKTRNQQRRRGGGPPNVKRGFGRAENRPGNKFQ